jgi:hypothetical protein
MGDALLLAYLAGIVDGEGSIGTLSKGPSKPRVFFIEVKMTSEEIIDLLHATIGGHKASRPSTTGRWKNQWRWRVTCRAARAAYVKLKPYLRLKTGH